MHKALVRTSLLLVVLCLPAFAASSSSLQWSWGNPSPNADQLIALAYGGGVYVAAGQDGVIYSSTDGTTWSQHSSVIGNGGSYLDALYAKGDFVLAGMDAQGFIHVTSSSDGVHWSDQVLDLPQDSNPVVEIQLQLAYGNGTFMLLSDTSNSGSEATSSDAKNWTVRELDFVPTFDDSLAYANGTFVVTGVSVGTTPLFSGFFYSSDGGVSWSPAKNLKIKSTPVEISDGSEFIFYIVKPPLKAYVSSDGANWVEHTLTGNPPQFARMVWDGSSFESFYFQAASQTYQLYSSADGLNWTLGATVSNPPPIRSGDTPHTVVATGSGYAALDEGPLAISESPDFVTWTPMTVAPSRDVTTMNLTDVAHGEGRYVAVGGGSIVESPDGATWKSVYTGTIATDLHNVVYGNGTFIVQGNDVWLVSSDGIHWTSFTDRPSSPNSGIVYGAGHFVAFSGCPTNCSIITSPDGRTWSKHAAPSELIKAATYTDIGYDGTRFVSVGYSGEGSTGTSAVYTSCDGITWVHSADIQIDPYTSFYRLQEAGGTLVALGISQPPCQGEGSECIDTPVYQAVAVTQDTLNWNSTTAALDGYSPLLYSGVVSDGQNYYAASGDGHIQVSSDALHWNLLTGVPGAAFPLALASNDTQIVAVGSQGTIIATAKPAHNTSPTAGGACTALPEAGKGGGSRGSLDMLTLVSLLSLFVARRRAGNLI